MSETREKCPRCGSANPEVRLCETCGEPENYWMHQAGAPFVGCTHSWHVPQPAEPTTPTHETELGNEALTALRQWEEDTGKPSSASEGNAFIDGFVVARALGNLSMAIEQSGSSSAGEERQDEGENNATIRPEMSHVPEQRMEVGGEGRERNQQGASVPPVRNDSRTEAGADREHSVADAPAPAEAAPTKPDAYFAFAEEYAKFSYEEYAKYRERAIAAPRETPTKLDWRTNFAGRQAAIIADLTEYDKMCKLAAKPCDGNAFNAGWLAHEAREARETPVDERAPTELEKQLQVAHNVLRQFGRYCELPDQKCNTCLKVEAWQARASRSVAGQKGEGVK